MNLIFIHGRAQGKKDPIELRKLWIQTFQTGLLHSNLQLPVKTENIFLPFYGKRLDKLVGDFNDPVEEIKRKGSGMSDAEAAFFRDFLHEISKNAKIPDTEIALEKTEDYTEKGPLNWAWVHAMLRALDKRGRWGELSLKKFTYDVFMYLTQEHIREEIDAMVKSEINPHEPCVVVGHSLGSVVGYNILRNDPTLDVRKYITVGSPLGLTSVKKYLQTPIKMPDCVKNGWYNAYDDGDVVALNPLDKLYFDINPSIENRKHVKNQTSNQHGIEGYLNDKEVTKVINNALLL